MSANFCVGKGGVTGDSRYPTLRICMYNSAGGVHTYTPLVVLTNPANGNVAWGTNLYETMSSGSKQGRKCGAFMWSFAPNKVTTS